MTLPRSEWLARRGNGGNLSKFNRSRERMVHLAAPIGYKPNPRYVESMPIGPQNLPTIPFVIQLGKSGIYNVGRNKSKRTNRQADIRARVAARRAR